MCPAVMTCVEARIRIDENDDDTVDVSVTVVCVD